MIEAKLSLFDVEEEESSGQASVFCQSHFGVAPEGLDTIDMVGASGELVVAVMDSEVALVA